jgi:hypothetical protein
LAFKGLVANDETTTAWDHLLEKRKSAHIMTYFLDRQMNHRNSKICFGDMKSTLKYVQTKSLISEEDKQIIEIDKLINWSPVLSESYWQVAIDNILVGGLDILICKNGCKAIIDTGSSLISGPSDHINKLKSKVSISF